ncbi:MAG: hypothetical protein KME50_08705 [Nostoc desertorum CM1-VF14]|nr:hypothetical protein [Nostoc desertorum CM1-VF14]
MLFQWSTSAPNLYRSRIGMPPSANAYLRAGQLNNSEKFYSLHAYVSEDTLLV